MKIAAIIPCYNNEEKTIEITIDAVINSKCSIEKEIIIVDDFSKDNTREKLKEIEYKVSKILYHEKNMGNGNLVVGGGLGGHWDPDNTQKHAGPDGDGHRGDLDALTINDDGSINQVVISAKIKYGDVKGRSFVIHANPDNYTDEPANGGSGARLYTAIF